MVSVFADIATLALIISPRDILFYRDILGNRTGFAVSLLGGGALISDGIAIDDLTHAVSIGTAFQLIPRIVRQSVSILVFRHHNDTWFAIAFEVRISQYQDVSLTLHVSNGMVEMKGNIPAISAQAHHIALIIGQRLSTFLCHTCSIVALFVLRHHVDKLSGGWAILIDSHNIWRMLRDVIQPLSLQAHCQP